MHGTGGGGRSWICNVDRLAAAIAGNNRILGMEKKFVRGGGRER
jgi:hypothetical protein